MEPRAIFFDLFETLITEFSNGQRLSNRSYDYGKLLGISDEDFKIEWRKRQEKRMNGSYTDYVSVIRDIVTCKNLQVDEEAIQYLYRERINEKIIPFNNIHPEVIDLLNELRSNHLKIGLISNCSEEEVTYWPRSRLAEYFDDCVFSFEVKCSKPDARIYSLACEAAKYKARREYICWRWWF